MTDAEPCFWALALLQSSISTLAVFLANLGLLAFFFVYAIAFTWTFDRVFGLPEPAAKHREA